MYSIKNYVFYIFFITNISNCHGLTEKLSIELGTNDSKSNNLTKKQNSKNIREQKSSEIKNDFDPALYPIRIMVTIKKKNSSFLQTGDTLKEAVESALVTKFEHLSNVDSYMIEMSEDCSRPELGSLVTEIQNLGYVVEFDELAHSATQSVQQITSDKLDSKSLEKGLKYNKNQWYIPEMNIDDAWNEIRDLDSRDVKVCVVDSGVDYKSGFPGRLETEKESSITEDGKGSILSSDGSSNSNKPDKSNILVSANFVDENFDPLDKLGHGTHVSGIISSRYRSSKVAGINPNARIIPCKAFDNLDSIRLSNIVRCIDFCLFYDAEIQNHSWVVNKKLKFLKRAFYSAHKKGVIMVVPAGNMDPLKNKSFIDRFRRKIQSYNFLNIDISVHFPAVYSRLFPNVVSVANLMMLDKINSKAMIVKCMMNSKKYCKNLGNLALNDTSMYGEGSVQVAAPGTNIYSLFLKNSHAFVTGTSSSAAVVTGILSLIKSISPKPQNPFDIRINYIKTIQILRESTRFVPDLEGKVGWKGLPDCELAVQLTKKFLKTKEKGPNNSNFKSSKPTP